MRVEEERMRKKKKERWEKKWIGVELGCLDPVVIGWNLVKKREKNEKEKEALVEYVV